MARVSRKAEFREALPRVIVPQRKFVLPSALFSFILM